MLPPKEVPVVLVFGGTFSPPHRGHVDTLVDAKRFLQSQGYSVRAAVMAPVGDRFVSRKLGLDALPLDVRVHLCELAAQQYPWILVSDAPGRIADTASKANRRMLADWAAKKYPHSTIVSLCGDEACPKNFPNLPAIYTPGPDDPDRSHHGYWYIGFPRPQGGVSSTKIRTALKLGLPLGPSVMHPDVETYLRLNTVPQEGAFAAAVESAYTESILQETAISYPEWEKLKDQFNNAVLLFKHASAGVYRAFHRDAYKLGFLGLDTVGKDNGVDTLRLPASQINRILRVIKGEGFDFKIINQ